MQPGKAYQSRMEKAQRGAALPPCLSPKATLQFLEVPWDENLQKGSGVPTEMRTQVQGCQNNTTLRVGAQKGRLTALSPQNLYTDSFQVIAS